MAIEDWSERVVIVHLGNEPQFGDDLDAVTERTSGPSGKPLDVVLDFGGVRFVTSSQIARLLKMRKDLSSIGGRMLLCAIDAQVWGAFLTTGLDKIFEFSDAVPTALASLQLSQT